MVWRSDRVLSALAVLAMLGDNAACQPSLTIPGAQHLATFPGVVSQADVEIVGNRWIVSRCYGFDLRHHPSRVVIWDSAQSRAVLDVPGVAVIARAEKWFVLEGPWRVPVSGKEPGEVRILRLREVGGSAVWERQFAALRGLCYWSDYVLHAGPGSSIAVSVAEWRRLSRGECHIFGTDAVTGRHLWTKQYSTDGLSAKAGTGHLCLSGIARPDNKVQAAILDMTTGRELWASEELLPTAFAMDRRRVSYVGELVPELAPSVWALNAEGKRIWKVSVGSRYCTPTELSVSRDGRWLAITVGSSYRANPRSQLWVYDSSKRKLAKIADIRADEGRVTGHAVSESGMVYFVVGWRERTAVLYSWRLEGE